MTDIGEKLEITFQEPRDVATVAFTLYSVYRGAAYQKPGITPITDEDEPSLRVTEGKLGQNL